MDIKEYVARETGCGFYLADAREISTFKGGGKALIFQPESTEKLIEIVRVFKEENVAFHMLGKGSNTLVSDGICCDVMISTKALSKVRIEGDFAVCECGASVRKVVEEGRKRCLGELEFLSGVPCSVGGALKMNAGAFGAQIGDYVYKMRVLNLDYDKKGKIEVKEINADDLHFSYRRGAIGVVLEAVLRLGKKNVEKSISEAREFLSKRREKQPALPSLGSTFKNGKIPSGKLIDDCGLKGVKKGGARISEKHANFIVNEGGASASDYLYLVELCKKRVYETTGVKMEEEFVEVK